VHYDIVLGPREGVLGRPGRLATGPGIPPGALMLLGPVPETAHTSLVRTMTTRLPAWGPAA